MEKIENSLIKRKKGKKTRVSNNHGERQTNTKAKLEATFIRILLLGIRELPFASKKEYCFLSDVNFDLQFAIGKLCIFRKN